ncbi:MAG: hypothetical protein H3C43_05940 [Leptonema sp. (in: Bacteria)]|nr:hypothetical protein [Leptonema sp. (in: bacteria)]
MQFSDTAKLFLESVGRSQEVEHYLKRFQIDALNSAVFAVIVPDADTCQNETETLLFQLKSLLRLGLKPALLLSGTATDQFDRLNNKLQDQELTLANIGRLDFQLLIKNDVLLKKGLNNVIEQGVKRIHFLRRKGQIQKNKVALPTCAPFETVDTEDQALVDFGSSLLKENRDLHISVCSASNLLKEIFTIKGAGTLFRSHSKIRYSNSLSSEELHKITNLIQQSFGRPLVDVSMFNRITDYYIEEDEFSGAILLETTNFGKYLSKFAVGVDARGAGVAQDLWQRVCHDHKVLFWRSRRNNTIHRWYERIADGFQRLDTWNVYWKGAKIEQLPDLIKYAGSKPSDFVD